MSEIMSKRQGSQWRSAFRTPDSAPRTPHSPTVDSRRRIRNIPAQQPKFGFLPEAERGGTMAPRWSAGLGQTVQLNCPEATFQAQPVS